MDEFPEGNDTVVSKDPCPKCGSKDNLVRYADGHAHCFTPGCDHFEPPEGGPRHSAKAQRTPDELIPPRPPEDLPKRHLEKKSLGRYGYFVGGFKGQPVHVAPYFDQAGNLVIQKLRWPSKEFTALKVAGAPQLSGCKLFGQEAFGDRYNKRVVITEGELDAMSVAQAMDFKCPSVSVNTGSQGAAKCLQANYLWLDRFDEIILYLDDDAPGRLATEECAKLFKVGKVRVARVAGFKDASEALQANKPGDIAEAVWGATQWRPRGIINASECLTDIDDKGRSGWAYPWPKVQDMLRGICPGEVTYHVAGTGIGKSTILNAIQFALITSGIKIGVMDFEHSRKEAQLGIMATAASRRLALDPLPLGKMQSLHKKIFGAGLVELFDPETAEWSLDAIQGYVRYMARALDCKVVFVDPLSYVVAGLDAATDERRAIDKVSQEFAGTARELGIALHIAHHLSRPEGTAHEEGGEISLKHIRGSGGIGNFAKQVLAYERNQQGDDPYLTRIKVLKNSPAGSTGEADVLRYNKDTGCLEQTDAAWPQAKKSRGRQPTGGFGAFPEGVTDF